MRVWIEVSVEIEDPAALIAMVREEYARSTTAVDVDGMTDEEALAVADLTVDEKRAHPRYVTPEHAIPDGAAAALQIIEHALWDAGAAVESSGTRILSGRRELPGPHPAANDVSALEGASAGSRGHQGAGPDSAGAEDDNAVAHGGHGCGGC